MGSSVKVPYRFVKCSVEGCETLHDAVYPCCSKHRRIKELRTVPIYVRPSFAKKKKPSKKTTRQDIRSEEGDRLREDENRIGSEGVSAQSVPELHNPDSADATPPPQAEGKDTGKGV